MKLSTKQKANLVIATVSLVAVLIVIAQNLTAVAIDIFYFTVETNLAILIPTIFVLGVAAGWGTNSFVRRRREKRKNQDSPPA